MINNIFSAPSVPTAKVTTKKAGWTINTRTKLALTLLLLV